MRTILTVTEEYWPEPGGGNLATHLIVDILSQLDDIRVVVVSGAENPARITAVKHVSTPLLRASNKIELWTKLTLLTRCGWFQRMLDSADTVYIPRFCYPLVPLANRRGKKVVVHLHNYQPISYNAAALCNSHKSNGLEAIKHAARHELMEHESPARAVLSGLLTMMAKVSRLWISGADKIICVSHRQCEIVSSYAPEVVRKMEVIYNPLPEASTTEKQPGKPTIMYLGGDSYLKGFHVFLRASYELLENGFDTKFMLTRVFKDTNRLLIKRLNNRFDEAYSLLTCPKHEQLLDVLSRSWALMFPSLWEEPLPYAVIEAMLSGTIPVASNVGGIPEIVGGTFAEKMLFEPGNIQQCADRLASLLAMSEDQVVDVGLSLRETVLRKFESEAVRTKLLQAFSD